MFSERIPSRLAGTIRETIRKVLEDDRQGLLPSFASDGTEGWLDITVKEVTFREGLGDEAPEGISGVEESDDA